jgi:hypothetical protein
MNRWTRSVYVVALAFLSIGSSYETAAQESERVPLYPTAAVGNEGCQMQKCFGVAQQFYRDRVLTSGFNIALAVVKREVSNEWRVEQILENPDTGNKFTSEEIAAIENDIILVAGTSSRYNFKTVVYVFARSTGTWSHSQTLILARPEDFTNTRVQNIAIHGDQALIVGLRYDDASNRFFKQVDFYVRTSASTFARRGSFRPPGSEASQEPYAFAMHEERAILGDATAAQGAGRAYLYDYERGWKLMKTFTPPDTTPAGFGSAVDVDESRVAIGAPNTANPDDSDRPGALYTYVRGTTDWNPELATFGPDRADDEPADIRWNFGKSVALEGSSMIVAAGIRTWGFYYVRENTGWDVVAKLPGDEQFFSGSVLLSETTAIMNIGNVAFGSGARVYELPMAIPQ